MRLRVLSDLHVDFSDGARPSSAGEDMVLLAGDIGEGLVGLEWAVEAFPDVPILYVPGNHEFYGGSLSAWTPKARACADRLAPGRLHILDRQAMVIGGIRFLGATLWTDYALFGTDAATIAQAQAVSHKRMLDYRHIRIGSDAGDRLLEPADTLPLHAADRQYLALALASGEPARTVVVTHHGPHRQSCAPQYAADWTSPAFISHLPLLMGRSALWVHGHTHVSLDYTVSRTRVLCNPRGYYRRSLGRCENPDFRWDLVVDLEG